MVFYVEEERLFFSTVTLHALLSKSVNLQLGVGIHVGHECILVQVKEFSRRPEHFEGEPLLWWLCGGDNCFTINCARFDCSIGFRLLSCLIRRNLVKNLFKAVHLSPVFIVALLFASLCSCAFSVYVLHLEAQNGEVEHNAVCKVAEEQNQPIGPKRVNASSGKDIDGQEDWLEHHGQHHVKESHHRKELVDLATFVVENQVPEPHSPGEEPKRCNGPSSDRPVNVRRCSSGGWREYILAKKQDREGQHPSCEHPKHYVVREVVHWWACCSIIGLKLHDLVGNLHNKILI